MFEDDESANIEWEQKKDVDDQTRASRRLDVKRAILADNKDKKSFKTKNPPIQKLSPNLRKIRNKIKDVFDEEEDDEEDETGETTGYVSFSLLQEEPSSSSSLLGALKEDEKQEFLIKQTLSNQKMQETAGKMEALTRADKVSRRMGMKGLKRRIIRDGIQDIALNTEIFDKALKENIGLKTKIKTKNLSLRETKNIVEGLKKVQQTAKVSEEIRNDVAEKISAKDLKKIGKTKSDKEAADIILKKSGRKEDKKKSLREQNRKKIERTISKTEREY